MKRKAKRAGVYCSHWQPESGALQSWDSPEIAADGSLMVAASSWWWTEDQSPESKAQQCWAMTDQLMQHEHWPTTGVGVAAERKHILKDESKKSSLERVLLLWGSLQP